MVESDKAPLDNDRQPRIFPKQPPSSD